LGESDENGIGKIFRRLFGTRPADKDVPPPSGATGDPAAEIVAWSQAQAKKSDDAHKAQIRAHAERPVPPTSAGDRDAIARARAMTLAIRHVFPPLHPQKSMSFLGGVPLGPNDLDYPMIHNRAGLLEPLTFMGQIDLGALPDGPARDLLPDVGYLYFFAPMSGNFDASALHYAVRYVAKKASRNWGPQSIGILPPLEGANAKALFPWLGWHDRPEQSYPRAYPRIEIELGWVGDGGEVDAADADAASGFPWDVGEQRRRAALAAFHGPARRHDPLLSSAGKPTDSLWIPFAGFPTNRIAVEILLGFLRTWLKEETDAIQAQLAKTEERMERSSFEHLLEEHKAFAQKHWKALQPFLGAGPDLPDETKQRILDLLEQVRLENLPPAFAKRFYQRSVSAALNEWISVAAIESAEAALRDPAMAPQIPAEVVEALRGRHTPLKDPQFTERGESAQHQMFGKGRVVQTAADVMAEERILLLQLNPDEGLGWRMGDYGVLQYWIHPADLAARRFEHATLTIESH